MSRHSPRSFAVAAIGAALAAGMAIAAPAASAQPSNPGGIDAPAVAADIVNSASPQDVFEIAPNHQVVRWRTVQNSITQWETLGGYATNGVATALAGTLETVFVRGRDGAVWYRERTGSGPWAGWRSLGGVIVGRPAALHAGNVTVVAVRGPNGFMYDRERTASGWNAHWRQVSSQILGNPALGAFDTGTPAVVFAKGRDGRMWTSSRPTTAGAMWSGWRPVPDSPGGRTFYTDPGSDPSSTSPILLVRGNNGACWLFDQGLWRLLGGRFISALSSTSAITGTNETFWFYGRGTNGKIYYQMWARPNTEPIPWHLLGTT